jgi:hypothetical protein
MADFPWSGRVVPEYDEENFRELIAPPYRVMYRIRANGITIEAIAHSSWEFK